MHKREDIECVVTPFVRFEQSWCVIGILDVQDPIVPQTKPDN